MEETIKSEFPEEHSHEIESNTILSEDITDSNQKNQDIAKKEKETEQ